MVLICPLEPSTEHVKGRVQTWLVFYSLSHSLLLGPQIEICKISRKTETTDKN